MFEMRINKSHILDFIAFYKTSQLHWNWGCISFCEDMCIPTRTFLLFSNDKPWFTGKCKQLRQAKEDAYRSGDKILYNQARNRLTKEIRVAKKNYSEKLRKELSANNPASVWTGLRNITMYKTPPPQSVENQ